MIFKLYYFLAFLSVIFCQLELPKFLTLCKRSDPKIDECLIANFKVTLPHIRTAPNELRLPSINPFHIEEVILSATDSLSLNLKDMDLYGLDGSIPSNIKIDFAKFTGSLDLSVPKVKIVAKYNIKGKILVLPIVGNGPATLDMENVLFHFKYSWKLYTKKLKVHAKGVDASLNYTASTAHFQLDNLFNGNKQLGEQMNIFLNENWEEFNKDIAPAISETVSSIILTLFNKLGSYIPYDDLWVKE